jgi:hypothetical protein
VATRRFRFSAAEGKLVEFTEPEARGVQIIGDSHYDGLQATDGTDISSRAKHKAYMKKNGLTIADDFKETWAKAEEKRADFYQGKGGSVSREDIGRAIHELESKTKRNR